MIHQDRKSKAKAKESLEVHISPIKDYMEDFSDAFLNDNLIEKLPEELSTRRVLDNFS